MYRDIDSRMVICPYNPSHSVSILRIQKHITKCKEKYPDVKLATCFFNYSHRFKPEDMLDHYEVCCNKTRIDNAEYEPCRVSVSRNSSMKSDPYTNEFPDINVKPKFYTSPKKLSLCSDEAFDLFDSFPESENDEEKNDSKDNISDSDGDLEPLPLPKTLSKAFVLPKHKFNSVNSEAISSGFGRAKNLVTLAQGTPELTVRKLIEPKNDEQEYKSFSLPPLVACCSTSVTSSMLDDVTTFKSESIISCESLNDDNSDVDEFVLENFDNSTNIS